MSTRRALITLCALIATAACHVTFVTRRSPLASVAPGTVQPNGPTRRFERVLVIVLENQDRDRALADPYLAQLAREGHSFHRLRALFHPSYANYLAMITGRKIPTHDDKQRTFDDLTIGDRLEAAGLRWKNYAEGYPGRPGACFLGDTLRYRRKHVPFLSSTRVQRTGCRQVVNASALYDDVRAGSLPEYMYYTPDMDNDGHDPRGAGGLAKASRWLRGFLEPLRNDPRFMRGTLVVVTFDESGKHLWYDKNYIYTVFLGDMVRSTGDARDEQELDHYNVLRTIEANFGLAPLGPGDSAARVIDDVWR